MIKNQRQLGVTKNQLKLLKSGVDAIKGKLKTSDKEQNKLLLCLNAVEIQMEELQEEIDHYNKLRKREIKPALLMKGIGDIPRYLIELRIWSGLTLKRFGELLGMKLQQVQQYEATDYQSVSLGRLRQIAETLIDYCGLRKEEQGTSQSPQPAEAKEAETSCRVR
jgi:hypothetical protein